MDSDDRFAKFNARQSFPLYGILHVELPRPHLAPVFIRDSVFIDLRAWYISSASEWDQPLFKASFYSSKYGNYANALCASKHVDDVSLHTHIHKYSDFLVVMIYVGFALAHYKKFL